MTLKTVAVIMIALIAVVLRVLYVERGNLIYDEYQHMHAAYLLSQGLTPFRDFFEHHTPLFYYLAATVIPMEEPSFDTLIQARYMSVSFHVLTVVVAGLWVRRLAGPVTGTVIVLLLASNVCFFVWGCRTYLDTYAAPLLIISAWALPVRGPSPWRSLLSALAMGTAILFTQKAVFAGLGPALIFAVRACREIGHPTRRGAYLGDLGAFILGALMTAITLPILLGVDGFEAFIRDAVVLNLNWKARHGPLPELREMASTDLFVYLMALAGLVTSIRDIARCRFSVEELQLPALYLLGLCLGVLLLPVVWEEYFVLILPFAVIVAGLQIIKLWKWCFRSKAISDTPPKPLHLCRKGIVVLFAGTSMINLLIVTSSGGRLEILMRLGIPILWIIGGAVIWKARQRFYGWDRIAWLLLILVFPITQQARWVRRHSNEGDRQRIEYVLATTSPSDPIFDGRSGYLVFRPNAYWYWFLHDEMQLMLSEQQKGPDIIRVLEEKKVPIVIVDGFTKMLPAEVLEYIRRYYEDTPFDEIKRRVARNGNHR